MLVSLKNIRQYVSLDGLTAEEIANGLTFAGVEVEEIRKLASGTNLVIGEIKTCVAHPDSDHLHILNVDLGEKYGEQQIVCGAPNARAGLKVIVARVGAKLPNIEIKAGVIRGQASNGMCCSLLELGVESKYLTEYQQAGIEELPEDAPVGEEDVLGYLGLDDEVLNLKVLANRPDLLSLFNVAREIGAIFSREVKTPEPKVKITFDTKLEVGSATERCSQFAGREDEGHCGQGSIGRSRNEDVLPRDQRHGVPPSFHAHDGRRAARISRERRVGRGGRGGSPFVRNLSRESFRHGKAA